MTVLVRDLMTPQACSVSLSTTIQEAAELLTRECVSELYITDEEGRLLGVIPDYVVLKALLVESAGAQPVSEFMSCQVLSCTADEDIHAILPLFREQRCRVLVVVREQKVVGQIDRRDLLRWIADQNTSQQSAMAPPHVMQPLPQQEAASSTNETPIPTPRFLQKRPSVLSSDYSLRRLNF
ncbi:MAG: CBS domain-containing protein [Planctomycetaceae bacterium]